MTEGLTDEDAVPEVADHGVTHSGDVWATRQPPAFVQGCHRGGQRDAPHERRRRRPALHRSALQLDYEGYTDKKLKIKGTACHLLSSASFSTGISVVPSARENRRVSVRVPPVVVAARVPECARGRRLLGSLPDHLGHEYFRAPRDPMGPFRMRGVSDCARIAVLLGYR
jgi:hypothetical protein